MAFERLRQQQEANEIAMQQAAFLKKQQDLETAQNIEAERQRIEAEYKQALTFRQESGIVDKLEEFTRLIKKQYPTLERDRPEWRSTPTSVADRIYWDIVVSLDNGDSPYLQEHYERRSLIAETFPDGTITIRGRERSPLATFLGFIIGEGTKGVTASLSKTSWRERPDIFEEPIYNAYQNPLTEKNTRKVENPHFSWGNYD